MLLRRLGVVLILWLCSLTAALAEKRVALLLAAEDYDFIRPLANPANDARALKVAVGIGGGPDLLTRYLNCRDR